MRRFSVMNPKTEGLKNSFVLAIKMIALTVVLIAVTGLGSQMLPATITDNVQAMDSLAANSATAPLSLIFAILFCQVVALTLLIKCSRWNGWCLMLAVVVILFGTQTFMSQIEALIYLGNKMPEGLVVGLFQMGLFVAAVFSPVAILVLGRWKRAPVSESTDRNRLNLGRGGWRTLVSGLIFLCLYYLFGYYIAWQDADLRTYYGGTDPGSFLAQMQSVVDATPWMLPMQYLRGMLWVGLGLLIIKSMRGPWWYAGLATALLFSVPSLYLLLPNPVMPDFPRITHLVETLPYLFFFGWFLAVFLVKRDGRQNTLSQSKVPE